MRAVSESGIARIYYTVFANTIRRHKGVEPNMVLKGKFPAIMR